MDVALKDSTGYKVTMIPQIMWLTGYNLHLEIIKLMNNESKPYLDYFEYATTTHNNFVSAQ